MEKLKATILAGGKGTRLAEETEVRPKQMVDTGRGTLREKYILQTLWDSGQAP